MKGADLNKSFVYAFSEKLTIEKHFTKIKTKLFLTEILFSLSLKISKKYKYIDIQKTKRFHLVDSFLLKKHFTDVLNKANDHDIYQLEVYKQKTYIRYYFE